MRRTGSLVSKVGVAVMVGVPVTVVAAVMVGVADAVEVAGTLAAGVDDRAMVVVAMGLPAPWVGGEDAAAEAVAAKEAPGVGEGLAAVPVMAGSVVGDGLGVVAVVLVGERFDAPVELATGVAVGVAVWP